MVSDEEIMEWAKKNYGEYANNLELMKKLYEKIVLGREKSMIVERQNSITKIAEAKQGMKHKTFKVVVSEIVKSNKYIGCSKCYKNVAKGACKCGEPFVELYMHLYEVGDETGSILVTVGPTREPEPWKVGDIVEFVADVTKYRDKIELRVRNNRYSVARGVNKPVVENNKEDTIDSVVKKIFEAFSKVGVIEERVLASYVERKFGVKWDDIKSNFVIVNGEVRFDAGGRQN